MTVENAKKTIDEMVTYWKNNSMTFSELKALEHASEALGKKMPQTIELDKNGLVWCSECHQILNYVDKYCSHCGQRLMKE